MNKATHYTLSCYKGLFIHVCKNENGEKKMTKMVQKKSKSVKSILDAYWSEETSEWVYMSIGPRASSTYVS